MCRSIRPLFNLTPVVTDAEVRAAALQFVRKVSGFAAPSAANAGAFDRAVDEVGAATRRLLSALGTSAPARDRAALAAAARARTERRFGVMRPAGRSGSPRAAPGDTDADCALTPRAGSTRLRRLF